MELYLKLKQTITLGKLKELTDNLDKEKISCSVDLKNNKLYFRDLGTNENVNLKYLQERFEYYGDIMVGTDLIDDFNRYIKINYNLNNKREVR